MSYHSGNHLIDPQQLLERARVHEGMHIADFGCGRTGHVIFPGSKIVGERGIVYAIDILKDVLENIRRRAALEALNNIETVWADLEKPGGNVISPKTLDVAFFVNVLFHFTDYALALDEAARILKPKARIVVVDWTERLSTLGPDENEDLIDFNKIKVWAHKNNFTIQDDCSVGPYHGCMILFRHD
ncbi:methyltransferase domain-containing protein [Candidatus Parcubacteria bacterium]|nr:methyltransferase domain-containing protein [Candidatus Parcubacteria bacterium]MBT3948835.1 methyltransferase domain-containing protein [Candidatus Parcubacteria bacterium]